MVTHCHSEFALTHLHTLAHLLPEVWLFICQGSFFTEICRRFCFLKAEEHPQVGVAGFALPHFPANSEETN